MVKCEGYREIRALVHGCWGLRVVQPLWETVWQLHIDFRKSESYPYDPEMPFLIPRGLKTCPHRNVCVQSVHSSIVHSYQNVATTQMAIGRGLDERDVGCPYSGVFLTGKGIEVLIPATAGVTTCRVQEARHRRHRSCDSCRREAGAVKRAL